jgi:protein involved in polysaccharide export with SLBB domain
MMMMKRSRSGSIRKLLATMALAILTVAIPASVGSQQNPTQWNAQQVELSRAELEQLLVRYEETAGSSAYSTTLREQARREAGLIRTRLTAGDFQVGDQVAVAVESEANLTGAFVVQPGPSLALPVIGRISLEGVLRSELQPHLQQEIGRYIRNPVVHARSSVRLMITGGVGQGGYHVVPTSTVFTDMLMMAGGPVADAMLQNIRVERANRVIWEGPALQQAIIEGRTLDQLSIQAGDHVIVPVRSERGGFFQTAMGVATGLGSIVFLISMLSNLFR